MRYAAYIGGLLGLVLLVTLVAQSDFSSMLHALHSGGWRLLWLIPYRMVFFFLYALGWLILIRPSDPSHRAGLGYLFWVTNVREAVDRLLPVASVGGGLVGTRLVCWRGIAVATVGASVIVEIVITLIAVYLFTALGLIMLLQIGTTGEGYRQLLPAFLWSLPVPVLTVLLLRNGSALTRLQQLVRPFQATWLSAGSMAGHAVALDLQLRSSFSRIGRIAAAAALQFAALLSGSFEVWFALRLFGHPVDGATAVVLESMTQAMRHLAFVVPAGLGVQEAGLVMFGHAMGVGSDLALAVSMSKRLREVLCGVPALLSWHWMETRRLTLRKG